VSTPLELPEIEIIRRDLEKDVAGRKIKSVEVSSMNLLPRYKSRKAFVDSLSGQKINAARRAGLALVLMMKNDYLVMKIGEGAFFERVPAKAKVTKGTEFTIDFTQGGQLRLVDPGKNSELCVVPSTDLFEEMPELRGLGMDPIADPIPFPAFAGAVLGHSIDLKELLCDDEVILGVGDIYSDEILFAAGLKHDRASDSLSTQEIRRLHRALVEIIHEGLRYRGTHLEERPFNDIFGVPGTYQEHLAVYGRHGDLSQRSRAPIKRKKYKGRWTYFCETQV
jgi:formamidopyrimidine-DNA glycosylase|tara:strand:- start:968 stop:1807 length:840 start_codon:yes stop_codon:yes gene_type:complete